MPINFIDNPSNKHLYIFLMIIFIKESYLCDLSLRIHQYFRRNLICEKIDKFFLTKAQKLFFPMKSRKSLLQQHSFIEDPKLIRYVVNFFNLAAFMRIFL